MKLLVLLIGDNNISNYTLIKFLQKKHFNFDKVMLIVTDKTAKSANNLKIIDKEFIVLNIEEEKGNIYKVKEKILNKLNTLKVKEIFLDFTGGLKTMSIGAYLAVNDFEVDKKYFSYVLYERGKSFLIINDDEFELNENLSIKEIANVHGIKELVYKTENSEFYSDEFVLWLLDKVQNKEKEFFEDLWDRKDLKKLNWRESLKEAPIKFDINLSNKKLKKLQSFITGDFLEEYIFKCLNEIKEESEIYEIVWSLKNGKDAKFEVDVVASKNNNLYLFSCTTDKKKGIVKNKGFEAKERATQIGGKNAKAIIVSCISEDSKSALEDDLKEKKGGVSPEVIVYEELIDKEDLKNRLKGIFIK